MSFLRRQILRLGVRIAMAFLFTGSLSAGDPKGGTEGGPALPKDDLVLEVAPLPDLEFATERIVDEEAPPSEVPWVRYPGDKVTVVGEVRNVGEAVAPPYAVAYRLRRDEGFDPLDPSPAPVMQVSTSHGLGLGAGNSQGLGPLNAHSFTIPAPMPAGKWWIEMRIDPQNEILEEDKENNRIIIGVVVAKPPKSKPGATPGGGYGGVVPGGFEASAKGDPGSHEARAEAIAGGLTERRSPGRSGVPAVIFQGSPAPAAWTMPPGPAGPTVRAVPPRANFSTPQNGRGPRRLR